MDKEAFPIIKATAHLRHFLLSSNGFRLLIHNRNLFSVLNPWYSDVDFKKETMGKLCRWGTSLRAFRYSIEHIRGEANISTDILSRWKREITGSLSDAEGSIREFDVDSKV
jgi:hypothetical protein